MPRPSVIPTVKAALEDYLERMQAAFLAVPDGQRVPTLPATPDQSAKANAQAAVEAQSATAELLEKLRDVVLENESLKAENMRLKARLEMIHSGMMVGVSD